MISEKLLDAINCLASANWLRTLPHIPLRQSQLIAAIEAEIAERVAEAVKDKDREIASRVSLNKVLTRSLDAARAKVYTLMHILAESKAAIPSPEHRPFDLEAAKRGEAIEVRRTHAAGFVPTRFVGTLIDGLFVVEHAEGYTEFRAPLDGNLRMAQRPMKTVWLNLSISGGASIYQSKLEAESAEGLWASVAIELKIPVLVPAK